MASFVRASKFRHVYCDPPRADGQFTNFRLSTTPGEQNFIKANPLYFALGLQGGGGPLAVVKLDKPQRMPTTVPCFCGHSAAVLDFDFNPMEDSIIASASEDTTIKVWGIPDGGLTKNITEPLVDLTGHQKKVTLIKFHPTASNVLLSASADQSVKLWDIEKGYEINSCAEATELIQDIAWDFRGDSYAISSKDKHIRFVDARTAQLSGKIDTAHDGSKSIKLVYLGIHEKLVSTGFTRQSERQFKIWDPRNTSQCVEKIDMDQAAGVVMPFFDQDTNILFLTGKGDGNIRYYEVDENQKIFPLAEFRSSSSAKGVAMVPKRGLDILKCETARFLKLTTNSVEPLTFLVPRKADGFQEDLYPASFSGVHSHTADEWLAGSSKEPNLMSMDPALKEDVTAGTAKKTFVAAKSPLVLAQELDAATKRIEILTARLAAAGLSTD
jgi:coronin-1B/1C/6